MWMAAGRIVRERDFLKTQTNYSQPWLDIGILRDFIRRHSYLSFTLEEWLVWLELPRTLASIQG